MTCRIKIGRFTYKVVQPTAMKAWQEVSDIQVSFSENPSKKHLITVNDLSTGEQVGSMIVIDKLRP